MTDKPFPPQTLAERWDCSPQKIRDMINNPDYKFYTDEIAGTGKPKSKVLYWPEKLTTSDCEISDLPPDYNLFETDIVTHIFYADNGVGPCQMVFFNYKFSTWEPKLTWETCGCYDYSEINII